MKINAFLKFFKLFLRFLYIKYIKSWYDFLWRLKLYSKTSLNWYNFKILDKDYLSKNMLLIVILIYSWKFAIIQEQNHINIFWGIYYTFKIKINQIRFYENRCIFTIKICIFRIKVYI